MSHGIHMTYILWIYTELTHIHQKVRVWRNKNWSKFEIPLSFIMSFNLFDNWVNFEYEPHALGIRSKWNFHWIDQMWQKIKLFTRNFIFFYFSFGRRRKKIKFYGWNLCVAFVCVSFVAIGHLSVVCFGGEERAGWIITVNNFVRTTWKWHNFYSIDYTLWVNLKNWIWTWKF